MRARTQEIRTINMDLKAEIANRHETEQALMAAKKEAEQANESKTRFLALASHDILQPLNAARLYLAAIDSNNLISKDQGNFEKLTDSLDSTVHLMSALLDIAKLEQGAMKPTPRHFNIDDILLPLANEYAIISKEKGLELKVRSSHSIVHSDTTYLRRIIQNLVSNAVKYTDSGKVLIACRRRKHSLRLEVWDTGPGISNHEQNKIFNDFYRIQAGDNKGIGLGLGVVKRLCDLLSITISVNSVVNQGSRFAIDIPYGNVDLLQVKEDISQKPQNKTQLNVIAVDDDPKNLEAMASLLDKWHCHYQLFYKVEDALAYAKHNSAPDVILMDYQLNDNCDGISLIKSLRTVWRDTIPAILITAVRDEEVKVAAKSEQIHYLSKPVKPAKLKALLNHGR